MRPGPGASPESADWKRPASAEGSAPEAEWGLRATLEDVPWGRLAGGLVLGYAVGLVLGLAIQGAGWWERGASWERDALVLAQRTVNPVLDLFFLYIPFFGTNYTLVPFVLAAVIWLWRKGYRAVPVHLAVVQFGSWALNLSLKLSMGRPRPDLFEHRGQYALPAYPSGHSIAVVSVMFTGAYLVDRTGNGKWGYLVVAVFFVMNSYSRVYNGVHWPTDVIAGTAVGLVWLLVTLAVFSPRHRAAERRRPARADTES